MSDKALPLLSDLYHLEEELKTAYWNVPLGKGPYPRAHQILAMHGIAEELRKVRKAIENHPHALMARVLGVAYKPFIEESAHA